MKPLHSLILVLGTSLASWIGCYPAQAQERLGNIGIPTPSERFFREGREQLEQEIHRLQATHPDAADLLIIDDNALIQEEDLIRLEDPRLHPEYLPSSPSQPRDKSSTGVDLKFHPNPS